MGIFSSCQIIQDRASTLGLEMRVCELCITFIGYGLNNKLLPTHMQKFRFLGDFQKHSNRACVCCLIWMHLWQDQFAPEIDTSNFQE